MLDRPRPPSRSVASEVAAAMLVHERRRPGHAAVPAGEPGRDEAPDQVLAALRRRRIRVFDLRAAAVIGRLGDIGPGASPLDGDRVPQIIEGRVRLRIDDDRWSLATVEASVIAVLLQVDPCVPNAVLFAEAFRRVAVEAERKVEAVHAWSHRIDPIGDLGHDGGAA